MRTLVFFLSLAFLAPAAVAGDDAKAKAGRAKPAAESAKLPENRRDPEERGSASAGASAAPAPAPEPDTARERGTDLGKEADAEDESLRKQQSKKP